MSGEDISKGKICTLKFKVIKEGNTSVQLSEVDACNDDGDVYFEDENVNSPSIQININNAQKSKKQGTSYIGIALIVLGIIGLIALGTHYILNKNK